MMRQTDEKSGVPPPIYDTWLRALFPDLRLRRANAHHGRCRVRYERRAIRLRIADSRLKDLRDSQKRGSGIDYEAIEEDVARDVKEAFAGRYHSAWIEHSASVERLLAELHLAFRWKTSSKVAVKRPTASSSGRGRKAGVTS